MKRLPLFMALAILISSVPAFASDDFITLYLESYQSALDVDISVPSGSTGFPAGVKTQAQMERGGRSGTAVFDLAQCRGAVLQVSGITAYSGPADSWSGVTIYWCESLINESWAWSGATQTQVLKGTPGSGVTDQYVPFDIAGVGFGRILVEFESAVSWFAAKLRFFREHKAGGHPN